MKWPLLPCHDCSAISESITSKQQNSSLLPKPRRLQSLRLDNLSLSAAVMEGGREGGREGEIEETEKGLQDGRELSRSNNVLTFNGKISFVTANTTDSKQELCSVWCCHQ